MCRVLGVSRSGWYASAHRVRPSERELRDCPLLDRIQAIHAKSRGTDGSPRVRAQLVREGIEVGEDRVARLMRAAGIGGRVRRRFTVTTNSRHDERVAPNMLDRQFLAETRDSVWCADITYIPTAAAWVYPAAIIDIATGSIAGWSMANPMRTELAEGALRNALTARAPAKGQVHHPDRGAQYAIDTYRKLLAMHGIECSTSRAGDCYDNAVIESFFGTFEQACSHHPRWSGLVGATAATHENIEVSYNRQRLHSSLGCRTSAGADQAQVVAWVAPCSFHKS